MIIKKYRDLPALYVPDVGEVVEVRRSVADVWTRAYVIRVQRLRGDTLKFTICWLADNPASGEGDKPIVAHTIGRVKCSPEGWPLLVRQISRGAPPPTAP